MSYTYNQSAYGKNACVKINSTNNAKQIFKSTDITDQMMLQTDIQDDKHKVYTSIQN